MWPNARASPTADSPITVLVVDDSLFMRTLISDLLCSDLKIQVVATASSGSEAIRKISQVRPDCVMLDLMMPGLDGLMTLKIIMAACPTPVIILSAHCQDGADISVRCLAAGAAGLIPKPSGEVSLDIDTIRGRLVNEVKHVVRTWTSRRRRSGRGDRSNRWSPRPPRFIVLGASTGGQPTLEVILGALPRDFSVPLLVVQHLPNQSLAMSFADRLNRSCALPVKVAEDGDIPHAGVIYVAPGGARLTLGREEALANPFVRHAAPTHADPRQPRFTVQAAPYATLTPSIDGALQSAATAYGSDVVGVILTGLGYDGVEGMRAIKAAGGRTIVQNRSAMGFEMPKAVIDAGLADYVLPVDEITTALVGAGCP